MTSPEPRVRGELGEAWIEMEVKGLLLDPSSSTPVVVLRSVGGHLLLPIWIGLPEANAIAVAIEAIELQRPMTHDLLRASIEALGGRLERVEIAKLVEATFHARLEFAREGEATVSVDARASDAIALAVRTGTSIWVAREVLEEALRADPEPATEPEDLRAWLDRVRPEDLGKYKM
ncbi:MAG: bifunctional nuclease family protein [Thermoanaerobaculia bacterium]